MQRREALRELIELLGQQRAVDLELAEPAALARFEIGRDQVDEVRQIGPLQPRKERAHLHRR